MAENLDLLGDPIPENFGGRGRPAHIPTRENRNKIRVLLAFGWTNKAIAQALRITAGTLRRHYSIELRQREEARPALKAKAIMLIFDAAAGGNVSAMKELQRLIEQDEIDRAPPRRPREPKLGKKEAADRAAQDGHEGTGWGSLLN